jgi:hypothetical protein
VNRVAGADSGNHAITDPISRFLVTCCGLAVKPVPKWTGGLAIPETLRSCGS